MNSQQSSVLFDTQVKRMHELLQEKSLQWSDAISLLLPHQKSEMLMFPYLFQELFPTINDKHLHILTTSGILVFNVVMISDSLMDNDSSQDARYETENILRLRALEFEVYQSLFSLFDNESIFWKRMQNCLLRYIKACQLERTFGQGKWREYSEQAALDIAIGKGCMAEVGIAGLCVLAKDDTLFENLTYSVQKFTIARQMWDDISDWKQDLELGIPSLLIARVLENDSELQAKISAKSPQYRNDFSRSLYYNGHLIYILEFAIQSCDEALRCLTDMPEILWKKVIRQQQSQCQELLDDVCAIIQKNVQHQQERPQVHLNLSSPSCLVDEISQIALQSMMREWEHGFGEARHIMSIPQTAATALGFSVTSGFHYGDIFQRALIADTLCDAIASGHNELQPVAIYESQYLIKNRNKTGIGGWQYFPTVPEVAPDADDLAQVMQVLLRLGMKKEVAMYCEKPLSVLLNDNYSSDGSLKTWIIPKHNRSLIEEQQAKFNSIEFANGKWNESADNEVIANIIYALALYDNERFESYIMKSLQFLALRQEEQGYWKSRWYFGNYYGTYLCTKLFSIASSNTQIIERAIGFIIDTQHEDGGWGEFQESDPLHTALALLTLGVAHQQNSHNRLAKTAQHGFEFLRQCYNSEGYWNATPFMRPRLYQVYSSRTISTMFVCKAALSWQDWQELL
jgi:squalene-hopene/tetraprenyl-beta-curcumene cyclase